MASSLELSSSFGDEASVDEIILEILNKGELQVGEKERQAQLDRVHHEVIDIVAGKLVDPRTKRVYTYGMIEKALAELSTRSAQLSHSQHHHHHDAGKSASKAPKSPAASSSISQSDPDGAAGAASIGENEKDQPRELPGWTGVVTTRSAKSQALDAMKALIAHQPIPVARARMRLRITCPTSLLKQSTRSSTHAASPQQQQQQQQAQPQSQPSHNESKKKKNKSKNQAPASKAPQPQPPQQQQEEDGTSSENKSKTTVKDKVLSYIEEVETQDILGQDWEVVGFVEPGAYKALTEFIGAETKGRGRLEVLDMAVVHEDQY